MLDTRVEGTDRIPVHARPPQRMARQVGIALVAEDFADRAVVGDPVHGVVADRRRRGRRCALGEQAGIESGSRDLSARQNLPRSIFARERAPSKRSRRFAVRPRPARRGARAGVNGVLGYKQAAHFGLMGVVKNETFPLRVNTVDQTSLVGARVEAPLGPGGQAEDIKLLSVEREGFDRFKQAAIEARTCWRRIGEKPPAPMVRHRDSTIGLNLDRSSRKLARRLEKLSRGRR